MFESRYDAMLKAVSAPYFRCPLQEFEPREGVPRYFLPTKMLDIAPGPLPAEAELPFDDLVIENEAIDGVAGFVAIRRKSAREFFVQVAYLLQGGQKIVTPEMTVVTDKWEVDAVFKVNCHDWVAEADRKEMVADIKAGIDSAVQLLYLLSIRGIVTETVEPPAALNKKRLKHGKPPLRPYILVKVGKVYDREGNEVPEGERRTVTPHIRAGHSRRQHHGPRSSLVKSVYIPATFVNYIDGAEAPNRPRIVTL